MNIYDAIQKRHSCRAWEDKPVEDDKLQRLLQAAAAAPTARNRQQFKLIVIRDAAQRARIAEAADQPFVGEAPVILAIVGLTPQDAMFCGIPTDPVDCAIVLDHVTLAAVAEGLGTCWIGHFEQNACREALGVPDSAAIIELMPLGYPAPSKPTKGRKDLQQLVCYDRFQ